MPKVKCQCGKLIDGASGQCPDCGRVLSSDDLFLSGVVIFILGVVTNFLALTLYGFYMSAADPVGFCLTSPLAWAGSLAFWGLILTWSIEDKNEHITCPLGRFMLYPLLVAVPWEIYRNVNPAHDDKAVSIVATTEQPTASSPDATDVPEEDSDGPAVFDLAETHQELEESTYLEPRKEVGYGTSTDNSRGVISESLSVESDSTENTIKQLRQLVPFAIMAVETDPAYSLEIYDYLKKTNALALLKSEHERLFLYQVGRNHISRLTQETPYLLEESGGGHHLVYAFREGEECREAMSQWAGSHGIVDARESGFLHRLSGNLRMSRPDLPRSESSPFDSSIEFYLFFTTTTGHYTVNVTPGAWSTAYWVTSDRESFLLRSLSADAELFGPRTSSGRRLRD